MTLGFNLKPWTFFHSFSSNHQGLTVRASLMKKYSSLQTNELIKFERTRKISCGSMREIQHARNPSECRIVAVDFRDLQFFT
jgi:hypothetical protein